MSGNLSTLGCDRKFQQPATKEDEALGESVWGKSAQGYLFQQSGLFIDGESLAAAIPMLPALAAAM